MIPRLAAPAILGGEPLFPHSLGIVHPCLPTLRQVEEPLGEILKTGNLTNGSRYVRQLELSLRKYLAVPYALAVSNATLGLSLALAGLQLTGEVILPGFTFSATALALLWNDLTPVFVDVLADTFTLDPAAVAAALTPRTAAILPVHIYGHPCEVDKLGALAGQHGLPMVFDAAHAFGSLYRGQPVGSFGCAEVFSFHATKIFPVGEGGCIATRHARLAHYLALARQFGSPGDEDTLVPGLNAKMQEFNAILGLAALDRIGRAIANRQAYAACLRRRLGCLPGLAFQAIRPYVSTNYQNFAILVDGDRFGLARDELFIALAAENIHARKYFSPPLHRHTAFQRFDSPPLPVTERVSNQVLCLPFYSEMSVELLDLLCLAIERIHRAAPRIRRKLRD